MMWQTPKILNSALMIGGLGVIYIIFEAVVSQKRNLSRYFKPHIEVIKPKEV